MDFISIIVLKVIILIIQLMIDYQINFKNPWNQTSHTDDDFHSFEFNLDLSNKI